MKTLIQAVIYITGLTAVMFLADMAALPRHTSVFYGAVFGAVFGAMCLQGRRK